MREILFRGKCLDTGEWVTGSPWVFSEPMNKAIIVHGMGTIGEEDGNTRYCDTYEVDPDTIGEFTGLYDANGKKVFEGDVLKISRKLDGMGTYYIPPLEYPVKVAVKWDLCAWMWETIEQDRYYISFPNAWCHFDYEVVGNIHDNPELLERSNND